MTELPYRCPECSSREQPRYTTWELSNRFDTDSLDKRIRRGTTGNTTREFLAGIRDSDALAVAVFCSQCGTTWGATVVITEVHSRHLVDRNLWIAEDVVAPDEDLEQARVRVEVEEFPSYQRYRDDLEVVEEADGLCPYCGDDVFPRTGFIPPAGEDRVLSVTAQYCPSCDGVLDVTWA